MTPTRITMTCGACGREMPRSLRRCSHCGGDLHASSPIGGVCPACRVNVRKTEIACPNCGYLLDPAALEQLPSAPVRVPIRAPTPWARLREALRSAVWYVRLLGLAVTALGATRVYLYLDFFRLSGLYEQQIEMLGRAAVWIIVLAAGLAIFAISFTLKPER